ncbi:MAG TPA: hypothetical protein PK263_05435 [bacterium]|nr:hypothetical protein [bacterium]
MERERITISIKKEVLDKIDCVIDGMNIRNRSHAIESLSLKGLGQTQTKKAVILLGGNDAIKAVPSSRAILKQLQESGFAKAFIAVGYLAEQIKKELGFGEEYDLDVRYSEKGEGSAGALKNLSEEFDQTFVVYNTKSTLDVSPDILLSFHQKHNFPASIFTNNLETNEGIYVFDSIVLNRIPDGFAMIEDDLIPELIKAQEVVFFPLAVN